MYIVYVYYSSKKKFGAWNVKEPKYVCLGYTCLKYVEMKV